MPLFISPKMQKIFHAYKSNVLNSKYYPLTRKDTLYGRITAVFLLNSKRENYNLEEVKHAEAFIKRTSTHKEEDFKRLNEFSNKIISWNDLEICSTYEKQKDLFCEYKIKFRTDISAEQVHFHARYSLENEKLANEQCIFIDQTPPQIRVIGDPVLHRPGKPFPQNPTAAELDELRRQIAIARKVLIATGGGGIAANQCREIEDPYQFSIVGVFNDDSEHVRNVKRRYPDATFPDAVIMINPKVIKNSPEETLFYHGCLSVSGAVRAGIKTPLEITVEYQTFNAQNQLVTERKTVREMDAIVLQHELNHINFGKTYFDCAVQKLSSYDLQTMSSAIMAELNRRESRNENIANLSPPNFYQIIVVDEKGKSKLHQENLARALSGYITTDTLLGMQKRVHLCLLSRAKARENNNADQHNEEDWKPAPKL